MSLHQSLSLGEQIADHLAQEIILGRLGPRERLREAELARELDVSTNSLREAFRLLQGRHLVEIQPRRGARVCDVTEAHVRDLYDFLFLLLSRLAGRVAERWQGNELAAIENLAATMEERGRQGDVVAVHDLAFQLLRAGLAFTRNRYLIDAIEDLMPLLQRYSYIALREETAELAVTLNCMQQLVSCISLRDVAGAAGYLGDYGENQCQVVLRAVAKQATA
ncbi:MAG: GntR family transcriptional regulator [Halomonadaceae bacterium]|nr:MAG: GntR family transcriptional regulator [Halomonadaceae bacterium]